MNKTHSKTEQRDRRHKRIRAKIFGTAERPRLSIFKSNKALSAQLIDDDKGVTIAASSSYTMKGSMSEKAKAVGTEIASKAKGKKVSKVTFDRGGFSYTGNIKVLADAAREAGLEF